MAKFWDELIKKNHSDPNSITEDDLARAREEMEEERVEWDKKWSEEKKARNNPVAEYENL